MNCDHTPQSFNSIALVSREEKRAQILAESEIRREKERIEHPQ